ncbi:indole-3-glycerol phosphate synthase TrpC [Fimbriimonas ginsengisoli]|uniref:Indole-3-glycerol phosphate synthase n=1 Tax=Fimbriimonas ginsengisoli Gsoil 348 TaxID=661478 RepID=A0A068NX33_FIMGI|nr:indole-3-glycerol phosphate synthase TrpC [Fimbriimonas ginsengisoli]AIE88043.1 indole-3-glycerol-phosphate synthase [Fimbriimonas ginsengisoli Gsoil 348]
MSVLERIFARKAEEVAAAKSSVPPAEIERQARAAHPTRGFLNALKHPAADLALIAEVKKASPSKGLIRPNFDVTEIARSYARAGATALSVLTDEHYFQGSPSYLRLAKEASGLPCLRKDFLNDPYQVYEARAWGADAILLIVAALSDGQLRDLHALATDLEMDVLVEVHTDDEADRALKLGAPLIGVNNRDLSDFHTTLVTSDRLLPRIAPHALAVSESALETRADLDRVKSAGAGAVLIGTTFCAAPDIEAKVREVMVGQA